MNKKKRKEKETIKGFPQSTEVPGSWSATGVQRRIHKRFRLAQSAGSRCLAVHSDLGLIYLIAAQRRRISPFFGDPFIRTHSLPIPFISPFLWLFR